MPMPRRSYARHSARASDLLAGLEVPLIAMIQGFCIGGGLATALQADLRIASSDSSFGIPAARLGVSYGYASLERLTALVGPALAKEIMFLGRRYTADQALAMRLVNQVVEAEHLLAHGRGNRRRDRAQRAALDPGFQDRDRPDRRWPGAAGSRPGRGRQSRLLRQRRLQGRPARVHGEADAAVPGTLTAGQGAPRQRPGTWHARGRPAIRNGAIAPGVPCPAAAGRSPAGPTGGGQDRPETTSSMCGRARWNGRIFAAF